MSVLAPMATRRRVEGCAGWHKRTAPASAKRAHRGLKAAGPSADATTGSASMVAICRPSSSSESSCIACMKGLVYLYQGFCNAGLQGSDVGVQVMCGAEHACELNFNGLPSAHADALTCSLGQDRGS